MRYNCYLCGYQTDTKSQIHIHHILPKMNGGKIGKKYKWNEIMLCPNCHSCIYVPTVDKGIHSKKGVNSIELVRWHVSTSGRVLEYKVNGIAYYK